MSFKGGTTRDLLTAAGETCFAPVAFDELKRNPEIE